MDGEFLKLLGEQQNPDSPYHLPPPKFRALQLLQLSQWRKTKKLVYLDLNFWIKFREGQASHRVIHSLLQQLLEKEKISCVLSSSLLEEMTKMDKVKQLDTARVMVTLCCQVVLNIFNISKMELVNIGHRLSSQPLFNHYYLSSIFEANPMRSEKFFKQYEAESPFIQNSAYAMSTTYSVEQAMTESTWKATISDAGLAGSFNQLKFSQPVPDYQQLVVEGLQAQVSMMRTLYPTSLSWTKDLDVARHLKDFQTLAPFQYLLSSLFAAIAVQKDRKMQVNDYYDTMQSCVAVPYADYFFTERSFKHLVSTKPIEQLESFTAVVESDLQKITDILQDLLR